MSIRIWILIILTIVTNVVSSYIKDDFPAYGSLRSTRQTNARQLYYHNIPQTSSYRPTKQSSYSVPQRPYEFQYSVNTGVGSGYSRGGATFNHREQRTLPNLVQPLIFHCKSCIYYNVSRPHLELMNFRSRIELKL